MRSVLKWTLRSLLALVVAACVVGLWKREEITRLWAVNTLFAPDRIVANFVAMDSMFLTRPMPRTPGAPSALPAGSAAALPAAALDWIEQRHVTSLVVVKGGALVFEGYYRDTGPDDLRISWSVSKSHLSALLGTVMAEGAIASLDDPVTQYAPQLIGGAYDGTSIRDVLTMSSGVVFDEDIEDKNSDIQRMGRVVALGGTLDDFTASFTAREADPGVAWKYVSIDTHVIGMVIRGATGRSIPDLLQQRILTPLALEQDGYVITDGAGVAFVLGGLNFTTRDYARFGVMIEQNGRYGGQQVVPADWIAESTRAVAPTEPGKIGYGYQWWVPKDATPGEFLGRGAYGQYLYIDQARDTVIVATAADLRLSEPGTNAANIEMFRTITKGL